MLYYIEQIVLLLGQSSNLSQKIERLRMHNEFTIIPRENNVKTKSSTVTETWQWVVREKKLGIILLMLSIQIEKWRKSSQILKRRFCGALKSTETEWRAFLTKGAGSNYGKFNNGSKFCQRIFRRADMPQHHVIKNFQQACVRILYLFSLRLRQSPTESFYSTVQKP